MKRPILSTLYKNLRRFKTKRDGVSTIEFAFVIGPFLLIMFGTMEVALIHLMRSSVANAVEGASRPIYTGTGGCATVTSVKQEICSRIAMKSEDACQANLKVILEELNGFNGARSNPGNDFNSITDAVDPGESESVMLLRTYFNWDVMFPLLEVPLGGQDGALVLSSTTAFKNEPFGANNGCQPGS